MLEPENKVGAISTFIQHLEKISGKRDGIVFFRGHSKSSYQLEPSIYRNDGWIANEGTMLKELMLRCPNDFSDGLSTFQSLVKMQHYSLPTRLLDITSNPLVALYFACNTNDHEDGEVIVLDFDLEQVKYFDSDTVSVISNISRRPFSFQIPSVDIIDEGEKIKAFNKTPEIALLLHDVRQDKPHFEPIIKPAHLGKVICVKPLLDNPRIIRQDGAFLLFGIDRNKAKPAQLDDSSVIARIKINKSNKKVLIKQLESLGISKATIFPEIEQVATHIKGKYERHELHLSELSEMELNVFNYLKNSTTEQNYKDIAKELKIAFLTASRSIRSLENKGLIESFGSRISPRWHVKQAINEIK